MLGLAASPSGGPRSGAEPAGLVSRPPREREDWPAPRLTHLRRVPDRRCMTPRRWSGTRFSTEYLET